MNDMHNLMIVEHLGWDMFAKILEENLAGSRCEHSKRKTRLAFLTTADRFIHGFSRGFPRTHFRFTEAILRRIPGFDVDGMLLWFWINGGDCDCKVLCAVKNLAAIGGCPVFPGVMPEEILAKRTEH